MGGGQSGHTLSDRTLVACMDIVGFVGIYEVCSSDYICTLGVGGSFALSLAENRRICAVHIAVIPARELYKIKLHVVVAP